MGILTTPQGIKVDCVDPFEVWRVNTLMTKEEGTLRWLQTITSGDVVYDVGANIGLYTLLAALWARNVYAFEPHAANAGRLLRNISLNQLGHKVQVITSALHDVEAFLPFNYLKHNPGSSGSQLGNVSLESGGYFTPSATELKHAIPLDRLVDDGLVSPATMIKIDVDGNEPSVLRGMRKLLEGPWVRSVQVEIHPKTDAEIVGFMAGCHFTLVERHHTSNGRVAIAQGAQPTNIPHNAVFERAA